MQSNEYHSFQRSIESSGRVQYAFINANGDGYHAFFYPPDFSEYTEGFETIIKGGMIFGFNPLDEEQFRRKKDEILRATVYKIIEDFFDTLGHKIILFHLDGHNGDKRQKGRRRMFEAWADLYPGPYAMECLELEIEHRIEYIGYFSAPLDEETKTLLKKEMAELKYNLITSK